MSHYSESPEVKNHHTQMNTYTQPTLKKKKKNAQTIIQQSKYIRTHQKASVQQRKQQRTPLQTLTTYTHTGLYIEPYPPQTLKGTCPQYLNQWSIKMCFFYEQNFNPLKSWRLPLLCAPSITLHSSPVGGRSCMVHRSAMVPATILLLILINYWDLFAKKTKKQKKQSEHLDNDQ